MLRIVGRHFYVNCDSGELLCHDPGTEWPWACELLFEFLDEEGGEEEEQGGWVIVSSKSYRA